MMKDITHRNHYVPQFYLKNWSNDGNKLWVYSLLVPHVKVPYWKEKSIEYLTKTDLSMDEISLKVGFSSASYYSKIFKKLKGISPLKYKKIHSE